MISIEARMKALMIAGLDGDGVSYRTLLDELSRHLKGYFLRRLGPGRVADAEDLVQETLLAVHARRATYDTERPFTVWLHAVARYKLIDYFRQHKMRAAVPIDDVDGLFAEDVSEAAMARHDVDRLLETIPPRARALIRSVKLDGHSIAETAAVTGMSESAVKVGIHRGVKALAMRMRGQVARRDE